MIVNRKVTGKASSMPIGIAAGVGTSIVLTVILSALTANLVLTEKVDISFIGYGAIATAFLSAAIGALLAAWMVKHRWMVVCLAAGACYYLMLLCCTALFFGGQYQGMGTILLTVLCGCSGVGLLGLRGEKRGGKMRKNYRPR